MSMKRTQTWTTYVDYSPYVRGHVRAIDAIYDQIIGPLIDIVWLPRVHLGIPP